MQRYLLVLRFAAMSDDPRLEPALATVWPGRATAIVPIEAGMALVVGLITVSYARARSAAAIRSPVTIHVIEHPNTDAVIDTGVPGDTTGDLLTFHNPVFNATNSTRAGRDQGDCIRISPRLGTWECRWLTQIQGQGSIMVEGAFNDSRDTTLAVTGGTGNFQNARGQMALHYRTKAGVYDFVFDLLP